MTFKSNKIRYISVKPYVLIWEKQNNLYTPFIELIIILVSNCKKHTSINQIRDKLKGFICTKNINISIFHEFSKTLFDNLIRKSLSKRIIIQKADKLHNINKRQQIVKYVLLSPLKA